MKRQQILFTIALLFPLGLLCAQNSIDDVLISIEENNTTLKALKDQSEAQKLENKTGITLDNPEVEYTYFWGSPATQPHRQDISVTQTFDLSTLFGYKKRVANQSNLLVETRFRQERLAILLEAKSVMIELTYYNALRRELQIRYDHAQSISNAYQERLKRGDANVLEANKVALNLANAIGELQRVNVERNSLLTELKRLNGGIAIEFYTAQYPEIIIPDSFDAWYAANEIKNPALQSIENEIKLNQEQIKLSNAMSLPSVSAGYKGELIPGQSYNGLSVGISLPLWANANRVKQAKSALKATESKQIDAKQQFRLSLENLYDKTQGLYQTAMSYRGAMSKLNNSALLKKALDAGQISLLDYILEIGLYYDTINQALLAERDYHLSLAELQAIEL